VISGLHCNFDKTSLLPIFPVSDPEREWIQEAGFTVATSIKLLGAEITADPEELPSNFTGVITKITSLISYWSRFKLSLPGRIAISKTFLISQINYLGSIFKPTDLQVQTMQLLINNFIKKNLKISDERMYSSPGIGGLGFFNISEFLSTQRCVWLFRAKKNCIDNWRFDLHQLAPNNDPLLIRSSDVCAARHPLLKNICLAYESFYQNFCKIDGNFRNAQIFENDTFIDPGTNQTLGRHFFGPAFYEQHKNNIRNLTYNNCFTANGYKTLLEFRQGGLPLSIALWMRLRNTLLHSNRGNTDNKTNTIQDLVLRWRKGGKRIRILQTWHREKNVNVRTGRTFITFSLLVGITPPLNINLNIWYSLWNTSSLSNDFRNFIYNSRFNSLPLNNRLNSYLQEIDPSCTFCRLTNNMPAPRDSMSHCFLNCPLVTIFLQDFLTVLDLHENVFSNTFGLMYWYGINDLQNHSQIRTFAYSLVFDGFRYVIFKNRLRKNVPSINDFRNEIVAFFCWICKFNKKIKGAIMCTFPNTIFSQALG
jgi:hypothetical protein